MKKSVTKILRKLAEEKVVGTETDVKRVYKQMKTAWKKHKPFKK